MALLKEDGSLDIERINQLPIDEYMTEMGRLTQEQVAEYFSKQPICESKKPYEPMIVDYDFDDEKYGTDADVLLDRLRKRLKSRK